ncbi:MAG: YggS family pyridoxal phosphate-dependent enzyme [Ignavibacteria bacterium]|nr:YggS family pyridoxal phosphate-dependent enzyme [Ignavibacteria bacterium]
MKYNYLSSNYEKLIDEIKIKCDRLKRNFEEIKLVAVSKTFPPGQILEVNKLGHKDFGENKVQELMRKYDELKTSDINWHLVGHLQTNKVKYIIEYVYLIHSVDSFKLALEINKRAEEINRVVDILVQVNTSKEGQKSGIEINETKTLCSEIAKLNCIKLKGLMTIGKFTNDEKIIRENFKSLRNLYEDLKPYHPGFQFLSMGMTSDFEIALEEGSNMLRIGSAIFGERNYN